MNDDLQADLFSQLPGIVDWMQAAISGGGKVQQNHHFRHKTISKRHQIVVFCNLFEKSLNLDGSCRYWYSASKVRVGVWRPALKHIIKKH